MKNREQVYIIDAEFSHLGFAEFDLGVIAAHLILATGKVTYLNQVMNAYALEFDSGIVQQMAGTEIIRRLIGLAQLPLERTLEEKQQLLATARELVLS